MKTRKDFLPFFRPSIGREEINEVVDSLKSGWLTMGPKTIKFENNFAKYIGVKYALSLNSCTAGLHLAIMALGIGKGDEVITPSLTFASTANVVVHMGAKPVFADIERDTFNIDPKSVVKKITKKTKAIIVVHYGGQPVDLSAFRTIARNFKIALIEDAAHAVGSKYKGKMIGSQGNLASFSFYATKNMTTGEGGMLTTNNSRIANFVVKNRLHGISKDAWKRYSKSGSWRYDVEYAGVKCNMTDIQASLGIHQLKKLNGFIKERIRLADLYTKQFKAVKGIKLHHIKKGMKHTRHLYPILVEKMRRSKMIDILTQKKIGTSVHFIPLHLQSYYKKAFGYKKGDLPITESVFSKLISLPIYPGMKDNDVKYVVDVIKTALN